MYLPYRSRDRSPSGEAYLDYIMKERHLPISEPCPRNDINPSKNARDLPISLPQVSAQQYRSTTIAATPNIGTKRLWMPPDCPLGCEATFLGIKRGHVHLRRTDNSLLVMPAAALSLDDLAYIEHNTGASMEGYRAQPKAESRRRSLPEEETKGGGSSIGGGEGRDEKTQAEEMVEEVLEDDKEWWEDSDHDDDTIGTGWEEVDDTFGDQDWPEVDGEPVGDFWTTIS